MIRRIAALSLVAALSGGFSPVSAEPVKQLLQSLPTSLGSNAELMFSANPLGQLALNSRHQNTTLEALLARISNSRRDFACPVGISPVSACGFTYMST